MKTIVNQMVWPYVLCKQLSTARHVNYLISEYRSRKQIPASDNGGGGGRLST